MAPSTLWWLLAATAVALELASGTLYLMMVGFGFVGAAIAAHLGAGTTFQIATAAVVASGSVVAWSGIRRMRRADEGAALNLDVGELVQVAAWNPDGTATVRYRGAAWTVVSRPGALLVPGPYRVAHIIGSRLLVEAA